MRFFFLQGRPHDVRRDKCSVLEMDALKKSGPVGIFLRVAADLARVAFKGFAERVEERGESVPFDSSEIECSILSGWRSCERDHALLNLQIGGLLSFGIGHALFRSLALCPLWQRGATR